MLSSSSTKKPQKKSSVSASGYKAIYLRNFTSSKWMNKTPPRGLERISKILPALHPGKSAILDNFRIVNNIGQQKIRDQNVHKTEVRSFPK